MVKETRYLIIVVDRSGWDVTRDASIQNKIEELDFVNVEMIQEIGKPVIKT